MPEESFDLVVGCDDKQKWLVIHRIFKDGRKVFITSTDISAIDAQKNPEKFDEFAKILGENILFLLPSCAKIMNIS